MKLYIIAAALFVSAIMIFAMLAEGVMEPASPPSKRPVAASQQQTAGHGYASQTQAPSEPNYPAAMPRHGATTTAGTSSAIPSLNSAMPSLNSTMPGMPHPGMPPEPGGTSGISGPIGISAPPAIPVPHGSSIQPTDSVPIIQPTDLGEAPTPTAGKQHQ
jgi:hypothetical protein